MATTNSREALRSGVTISRLSSGNGPRPSWSLAVFAHNESGRIGAALESVAAAADGHGVEVIVLANGCTDSTADEVRGCASAFTHLSLVEIDVADKANAWNTYIHEIVSPERAREIPIYFFMDGDVTLEPHALSLLATALQQATGALAAGGMPASGRDRDAWRERMVRNGTIAGNLYALSPRFVDGVRSKQLRMPVGLIGEDLFLSWLVAGDAIAASVDGNPRCIFCANAEFSFRSLSPMRPADWRTYVRRKWRYTYRALQLEMLMHVLRKGGLAAMPRDTNELYAHAPLPSRLKWVGLDSAIRTMAVLAIRKHRKQT